MQAIMEAIIYVADDPVKMEQFKDVFPDESRETIEQALNAMVEAFQRAPRRNDYPRSGRRVPNDDAAASITRRFARI